MRFITHLLSIGALCVMTFGCGEEEKKGPSSPGLENLQISIERTADGTWAVWEGGPVHRFSLFDMVDLYEMRSVIQFMDADNPGIASPLDISTPAIEQFDPDTFLIGDDSEFELQENREYFIDLRRFDDCLDETCKTHAGNLSFELEVATP